MTLTGSDEEFIGYKWEPEEFNIASYVGDSLSFRVRLREKLPNGNAGDYVPLDDVQFLSQVRDAPDRSAGLLKTLTISNGDQVGEVVISLPDAEVQTELHGFWDLQVTWADPVEVITYLAGTFDLTPKDVSNV